MNDIEINLGNIAIKDENLQSVIDGLNHETYQ